MKAIVLSDSHKNFNSIRRAIEKEADINLIIHAGDVQRDVDDILDAWPELPCEFVLGNNDFNVFNVPTQRVFVFGGKKIFLTHGHLYGVRNSTFRLVQEAKKTSCRYLYFRPHPPSFADRTGRHPDSQSRQQLAKLRSH